MVKAPRSTGLRASSWSGGWGGNGASQGKELLFTGKPQTHFDLLTFWAPGLGSYFWETEALGGLGRKGEGPQVDTQICLRYPACPKWLPLCTILGPLLCRPALLTTWGTREAQNKAND